MGFMEGKENVSSISATHRSSSNMARKFGTPLRNNVDQLQRSTLSSLKKKVRVRRTPQSATAKKSNRTSAEKFDAPSLIANTSLFSSVDTNSRREETVVFLPGPVGLEVEPANEAPTYGCRVTRFVDGGLTDPGQARKSGRIKPGDLVLKVETEGTSIAATTYDEIARLLQISHRKRIITFQSIWESQGFIPAKMDSVKKVKNDSNGIISPSPPNLYQQHTKKETSSSLNVEHDILHSTPFQNVLHSLSSRDETCSPTSPIRNRKILMETTNTPNVVPLEPGAKNSFSIDDRSKSFDSSFSSDDTTKSSNKSSTTTSPRHIINDRPLLYTRDTDESGSESGQVSNDLTLSRSVCGRAEMEENDFGQQNIKQIDAIEQQLQQHPKNNVKDDHQRENITKSEIKRQQSLFEDSLARADYEQRLQIARRQHSKAERELKDLYIHTRERNENRIRELQVDRDSLQSALEESKTIGASLVNRRIKELERHVAEAEKVKMQTQIEAREKVRAKAVEYSRLAAIKEIEWTKKITDLQEENYSLQEQCGSRLVELNMSRTMVTEMESRILANESEKDTISERLEIATCTIQTLEDTINQIKEEGQSTAQELEVTRKKLDKVLKENERMTGDIESYESFKEESSVLTEKLVNSIQEKQKAVIESKSIASKLEAENDNLTKQIAEATSDVEQLVEEKLLLEDKLARTWKDIERARTDASTMHETLLEKLEKGEYLESADIERKENTIQALSSELISIKGVMKEEIVKSNKKAVLIHLKLREAEQKLLQTEISNKKNSKERDSWQKRSIELDQCLADTQSQLSRITEMYRNEKVSTDAIKAQMEDITNVKTQSESQYQKLIQSLSSELESKKSELLSCKSRLTETESLQKNAIAEVDNMAKHKQESELLYQKSIESLSLQLESKKSDLSALETRINEVQSLKNKHQMVATNLKAQIEAMAEATAEVESEYKLSIDSLSLEVETKTKEISSQFHDFKTAENDLKQKLGVLLDEKKCLATKYGNHIEALEARLRIEETSLASSKETENRLRQSLESLAGEKRKEKKESKDKIEALTASIQSQCEEFSSLEMRFGMLEEDYNTLKSTHNKAKEKIDGLLLEKEEIGDCEEKDTERLNSKLETRQSLLETPEGDLDRSIDRLASKIKEERIKSREGIEDLSNKIESARIELSNSTSKLKMFEDAGIELTSVEKLRKTIESLKLENQTISTQYWESIKDLTTELQDRADQLSRKQFLLDSMEEEVQSSKIAIQELEHNNFQKGVTLGDIRDKIAAQANLIKCNEVEKLKNEETISSLQTRIDDLEKDVSDKLEIQKSCGILKKTVADLQYSKEKISSKFYSEVFRLVKRMAILNQTHNDVNEQRVRAMEIAVTQRKKQAQAESRIEELEKKLQSTSNRATQLENKLKHNLHLQKEDENKIALELTEKTKQLEHQNVMTSSLQAEVSAMIILTKHLQDSKERELSRLKTQNYNLQSALSSEKKSNALSTGEAHDAKIELKMLDKKYSSMLSSKDEALLKSENSRTSIARSLLHANAVITSLRVQLKEKDRLQESVELLETSTEKIDHLRQTILTMSGKLEDQEKNIEKLTEELKTSEMRSFDLKEDLERTESDHQCRVEMLQRQVLSTRATVMSKHKHINCVRQSMTDLNDQLLFLQDAREKESVSRWLSEHALKRSILHLRAHYISKHLTVQTLQTDISNLRKEGNMKNKRIDELQEINTKIYREMEKMGTSITENERHNDRLQRVVTALDETILCREETSKRIAAHCNIKGTDKRVRLLKNIESLSSKLMSMEEFFKQREILHQNSEESLKKTLSKLRAEYVVKHLETNDLKKQIAVLHQDRKFEKKETATLNSIISNLQANLENSNIAMLEKERELEQLERSSLLLQETLESERTKMEEEKSNRQSAVQECFKLRSEARQLLVRVRTLEKEKCAMTDTISKEGNWLRVEEEKFNQEIAEELAALRQKVGKLEAENFAKSSSLDELSSTLESIRGRFKELLGQKNDLEEKLDIANNELSLCRELAEERQKSLSASDLAKSVLVTDIAALREELDTEKHLRHEELEKLKGKASNVEETNRALHESIEHAKNLKVELEQERIAHWGLQAQVQRDQIQCKENQHYASQLKDETDRLRELLRENEESMSILKNELKELREKASNVENKSLSSGVDPPMLKDEISAHLSSVKDAFNIQAAVLDDVKLSEAMLETLIKEVMNLASQSESEMLELSSVLGTVDDLLLNPSGLLSSLDLAGLDSSEFYFREVRSRLEELAALAYKTSVELNNRQNQLTQWRSNRAESPSIPLTPPCSKQLKRTLFDSKNAESPIDVTPVITDGAKEVRDKIAGARLLCCVLENHNKLKLASAFRKWTCAAGAIGASANASSQKDTAVELAHELEITREKLMALKEHLKTGKGGKQKPRLRRILERLDGNVINRVDVENRKTKSTVDRNTDQSSTSMNQCSFEL